MGADKDLINSIVSSLDNDDETRNTLDMIMKPAETATHDEELLDLLVEQYENAGLHETTEEKPTFEGIKELLNKRSASENDAKIWSKFRNDHAHKVTSWAIGKGYGNDIPKDAHVINNIGQLRHTDFKDGKTYVLKSMEIYEPIDLSKLKNVRIIVDGHITFNGDKYMGQEDRNYDRSIFKIISSQNLKSMALKMLN